MSKVIKIGEVTYSNVNTILVPSGKKGATENDVVAFGGTMLYTTKNEKEIKEYDNLPIDELALIPKYLTVTNTDVKITDDSKITFTDLQGEGESLADHTVTVTKARNIELPISKTGEIEPCKTGTNNNKLGFKLSDTYKAELDEKVCKEVAISKDDITRGINAESAIILSQDNYAHILFDGKDIYRLEKRGQYIDGDDKDKHYAVYRNENFEEYSFIKVTFERNDTGVTSAKLTLEKITPNPIPVFTLVGTTLNITVAEEATT